MTRMQLADLLDDTDQTPPSVPGIDPGRPAIAHLDDDGTVTLFENLLPEWDAQPNPSLRHWAGRLNCDRNLPWTGPTMPQLLFIDPRGNLVEEHENVGVRLDGRGNLAVLSDGELQKHRDRYAEARASLPGAIEGAIEAYGHDWTCRALMIALVRLDDHSWPMRVGEFEQRGLDELTAALPTGVLMTGVNACSDDFDPEAFCRLALTEREVTSVLWRLKDLTAIAKHVAEREAEKKRIADIETTSTLFRGVRALARAKGSDVSDDEPVHAYQRYEGLTFRCGGFLWVGGDEGPEYQLATFFEDCLAALAAEATS